LSPCLHGITTPAAIAGYGFLTRIALTTQPLSEGTGPMADLLMLILIVLAVVLPAVYAGFCRHI
jgi:hypothetical protein